ncbi:hypothetical protein HYV89_05815 [Candidatus Woesearchaeota archaeon]|nr:hypothetical protein [Candidatus Woesearchaeota archaeon]
MAYDDEFMNRMELLERYSSLIREVSRKRIPFGLRSSYRDLVRQYDNYNKAPLEKSYLRAANPAFEKKLNDFEINWRKK